uniref:Uncharacterized protein n=1 Tax=Hyaloperonospora arabidopsidis (strain Emoy2) TaxID=559515 RepID=M4C079_HYAAE
MYRSAPCVSTSPASNTTFVTKRMLLASTLIVSDLTIRRRSLKRSRRTLSRWSRISSASRLIVTKNLPLENDAPPVMLHQLVNLHPSKFIQDVLNTNRARLDKFWTPEQVEKLETDHRDLVETYGGDVAVREAIDKHDAHTLFNDAWDCVPRSKRLRSFCGDLATFSSNKTSIESDFSSLIYEHLTALMLLSLESICRQATQKQLSAH